MLSELVKIRIFQILQDSSAAKQQVCEQPKIKATQGPLAPNATEASEIEQATTIDGAILHRCNQ